MTVFAPLLEIWGVAGAVQLALVGMDTRSFDHSDHRSTGSTRFPFHRPVRVVCQELLNDSWPVKMNQTRLFFFVDVSS